MRFPATISTRSMIASHSMFNLAEQSPTPLGPRRPLAFDCPTEDTWCVSQFRTCTRFPRAESRVKNDLCGSRSSVSFAGFQSLTTFPFWGRIRNPPGRTSRGTAVPKCACVCRGKVGGYAQAAESSGRRTVAARLTSSVSRRHNDVGNSHDSSFAKLCVAGWWDDHRCELSGKHVR